MGNEAKNLLILSDENNKILDAKKKRKIVQRTWEKVFKICKKMTNSFLKALARYGSNRILIFLLNGCNRTMSVHF